ncbi:hypothetical protein Ahy_B06g081287 [Arachis hypogaea]|uniref:DUF4283 domain-containing protein n=1 Tax=Arachis hypogaea TaxID=3818 RepID=A0A444YKS2_ARAHY|nr:hypothetical protein Ahy_B06g081287 [Arachis hypogaea]
MEGVGIVRLRVSPVEEVRGEVGLVGEGDEVGGECDEEFVAEEADSDLMRGGYVRGGHSRSHNPGKKVRTDLEGHAFTGDSSPHLTPREEEWMLEKEEEGNFTTNPKRSFSDTVKKGRVSMDTEKVSHISSSGKELMEEDEDRRSSRESEVNMEGSQIPEITVEKIEGIFNFKINEAAMKELRYPWWDTLIVKLLGRRISLLALTRRLEAMWGKMGNIEVIDLGNDFFIVKFYSQEDLDFPLTEGIEVRVTEKEKEGVEGIEKTTTVDRVGEGNPDISKKDKGKQVIEERNEAYGPWMLVQRSTRGRKGAKGDNTTGGSGGMEKGANGKGWGSGTRCAVLRTQEDEVELEGSNSQQNIPSKQIQVETEALNKENKLITSNRTHKTQNHAQTSKPASPRPGDQPNPTNPKPKKTFNSNSDEPITTQKIHEPISSNPGPLPSPFNPVPNKPNNIASSETKIVKNQHSHHPENWTCTQSNTQVDIQDTFIQDSFLAISTPMEEEINHPPDPKPPDLHSIETEIMLEAAMELEKEQEIQEKTDCHEDAIACNMQ